MVLLSYAYRFVSNFAFLAVVYFSLNFLVRYDERTIIAFLVLLYSAMRLASVVRSFSFLSRIERLEAVTRSAVMSGPSDEMTRKSILREVADLRHQGEMKAYIDLLFLALTTLLCVARIVSG